MPPQIDPLDKRFYKKLYGDKERYVQVIVNFLSNAIKFSNPNSKVVIGLKLNEKQRVKGSHSNVIRTSNKGNDSNKSSFSSSDMEYYISFDLTIQDFGMGISKEKIGKLFFNFSKLEEHASANPGGTGLGLSICKSLIEEMGGSIRVESKLNQGTSFIVTCKS